MPPNCAICMTSRPELKLTSILNMIGDFRSIQPTVRALSAQSVRENLELIIVATKEKAATIDREQLKDLGAFQIIEVDSLPSGAFGWARGIRAARAPVVVLSEDHSFPAGNWARTLIDAHAEDDYFAVSPAVDNGNPQTCTSWANFLLSFVEWYAPDRPATVVAGAGHNTSYKRDVLLAECGENLEAALNPERVLHLDMTARGKKILLDSRTSVAHVNISLPTAYFGMSYAGGRVFGGARAANWNVARTLFYAMLFPLVPFIRLRRLLGYLNTPEKRRKAKFMRSLPLIMIGLFCHAFGEAVGYMAGVGNIIPTYTNYELHRPDFVAAGERAEIWGS